jgi:hypothetical protein
MPVFVEQEKTPLVWRKVSFVFHLPTYVQVLRDSLVLPISLQQRGMWSKQASSQWQDRVKSFHLMSGFIPASIKGLSLKSLRVLVKTYIAIL